MKTIVEFIIKIWSIVFFPAGAISVGGVYYKVVDSVVVEICNYIFLMGVFFIAAFILFYAYSQIIFSISPKYVKAQKFIPMFLVFIVVPSYLAPKHVSFIEIASYVVPLFLFFLLYHKVQD